MHDSELIIAKELIEILAKHSCVPTGFGQGYLDIPAEKKIIEAARINYVLPSFCAERNVEASKCIKCIIDHQPPAICRPKVVEARQDNLDISWDTN